MGVDHGRCVVAREMEDVYDLLVVLQVMNKFACILGSCLMKTRVDRFTSYICQDR